MKSADGGGSGVTDGCDPWLRSSGGVAMTSAWERRFGAAVTGFSRTKWKRSCTCLKHLISFQQLALAELSIFVVTF